LGADAGRAALPYDVRFVSYLLDGDRLMVFTLSSRDLQAKQLDPGANTDERKQLFAMGDATYEATTNRPATRSARPTEGTHVGRSMPAMHSLADSQASVRLQPLHQRC
jgi:hypothetical protein